MLQIGKQQSIIKHWITWDGEILLKQPRRDVCMWWAQNLWSTGQIYICKQVQSKERLWSGLRFGQIKSLAVQFSLSVVSNSLGPHESQHARPPCPSPTPGVHSDSRPSSQWCYPAISSSVVPFSSCLQSLPAAESFPMSQLFAWDGQSTGVSALASFLPKKFWWRD